MGQNDAGQPAGNMPDQSAVDKLQAGVNAQSFEYEATGIMDSLFGDEAGAQAAFAKAQQIESAPVAAGGGAGYKFSPHQIETQLTQCTALIDGLKSDGLTYAGKLVQCRAPAKDTVASVPQAQAVSQLGQRLEQRVQNQIKFVQDWMGQLQKVKQNYLNQEGHTEAMWNKMAGSELQK